MTWVSGELGPGGSGLEQVGDGHDEDQSRQAVAWAPH